MQKFKTYEEMFVGVNNPFTTVSALLPSSVTADNLHAYMIAVEGHTPMFNDNEQIIRGVISAIITANANKYNRINAAVLASISPVGRVDITDTYTKTGIDTHANAHTGTDTDTTTRTGRDTTTTNATVTDKANTYDNATLRDTAQSVNSGGNSVTYGSTTTDTKQHGHTSTLTDTYGTTTTHTKVGTDGRQATALMDYMRAVNYSLLRIIIDDVLTAISAGVYMI